MSLPELTPVTTGGTNGLWLCRGDKVDDKLQSLLSAVNRAVPFLKFVVDKIECTDNFLTDKALLKAKLSRSQMNQKSAHYATSVEAGAPEAKKVCPVDFVSPVGVNKVWYGGEKQFISASAANRRAYGLDAKQAFLKRLACGEGNHEIFGEAGLNDTHSFAMLLSSISEGGAPPDQLKTNLHDKIAVIHLDGNGAGQKQKKLLSKARSYNEQIEAQQKFDSDIGSLRQQLSETVLDVLQSECGLGSPSSNEKKLRDAIEKKAEKVIRFEALLWAGDEITFIVPARLGWKVTQALVGILSRDDAILKASIGLVYCHHDAPIARIRALADNLCTHVKGVDRERNLVFPLVLESFDHIGRGLDDYLSKRASRMTDAGSALVESENRVSHDKGFFILDSCEMTQLQTKAIEWTGPNSQISRRKIRLDAFKAHQKRNTGVSDDERFQMLMEEYWDYLVPSTATEDARFPDEASIIDSEGAI